MNKKRSYRYFLVLLAGIAIAINCRSQVTSTTTDTVITDEAPAEEDDSVDETSYYPDTLKQQYRSITDDSILAVTSDKGFYYKRYMDSLLRATQIKAEKPRQVKFRGTNFFNSAFGVLFWIAAICLFGYLVFKLFLSNSSFFSRNRKNLESDITTSSEENADPDALLHHAIRNGNYRLAVRYLYLQSLQRLSEKRFIEINTNKTNYEYVKELKHQKFANEFATLTLQYEYVWYGEYPIDRHLYEQIQNGFTQFNKNYTR